jgi:hypothetical protein
VLVIAIDSGESCAFSSMRERDDPTQRPSQSANKAGRLRRIEQTLTAAALVVVIWFFYWTVNANNGFEDWGDMDYYRLLVRGWKKGQLSLDKAPAPELLALPDPYDPNQNGPYKLGDATLFRGKYYIYFGPSPALTLMLPFSVLIGKELTTGGAVFVFCSVAFLAASALWLTLRRRYFPDSHLIIAPLGVLALGFGTHLLSLAQRPMMWELPISSGIAFTTLAVLAACAAIHGRRPVRAMALAGLLLGLAVGARPTCLFASVLLLAPLWHAYRIRQSPQIAWRMSLAASITLGICGLALMAHNYARFENPLEWGQNYQLSGAYEGKLTHFSIRFLPHNFAVYFFQLLQWSAEFPFLKSEGIEISHIPGYFGTEEVAGLAATFPFIWFLVGLPLVGWRRDAEERRTMWVTLGCIAGYLVPVMALVMCYFSTTTRYQADFALMVGVMALLSMLAIERWAQHRAKPVAAGVRTTLVGVTIVTVVIGVFASFDYHGRSMQVTSPGRWQRLERTTHDFVSWVGLGLGKIEGPRVLKARFKPRPVGTQETFWRSTDVRAAERIVVEHIGDHLIRFGFARGEESLEFGRPLRWDDDHTHTVSVQVPSLYTPARRTWWEDSLRDREFRQRSCVAVWFSGGRALGIVVPPLPRELAGGGGVGPDFSGEIRSEDKRIFRRDELEIGLANPHAKRGGVLSMRVVFADSIHPKGEPIFAAGANFRSSIVFVEAVEGGLRFAFENYTFPRVHSPVFQPRPEGHMVELEMASFRPEAYGIEATGDVVIRLDGKEMMRTRQIAYPFPFGDEHLGSNPFGTTCDPTFRGWLYDARWSAEQMAAK